MTLMWFGLAAIALVGAGALLYIDRIQRQRVGRVRQIWAKSQGYTYNALDANLPATWRRAALAKQEYLSAVDIVSGVRRGEQFFLFDLEDAATIVAVRREIGSDVDIDLRLKTTPPPRDADLELLGTIGPRIVFATDLEIARRVCDQRMAAFTEALPPKLQLLWSEGIWTLGSLPVATSGRDWDDAIDAVARLSGMLHVLPPAREPDGLAYEGHDPGRPRPPQVGVVPPLGADDAPEIGRPQVGGSPRLMQPPRYPAPERARSLRSPDAARPPAGPPPSYGPPQPQPQSRPQPRSGPPPSYNPPPDQGPAPRP